MSWGGGGGGGGGGAKGGYTLFLRVNSLHTADTCIYIADHGSCDLVLGVKCTTVHTTCKCSTDV